MACNMLFEPVFHVATLGHDLAFDCLSSSSAQADGEAASCGADRGIPAGASSAAGQQDAAFVARSLAAYGARRRYLHQQSGASDMGAQPNSSRAPSQGLQEREHSNCLARYKVSLKPGTHGMVFFKEHSPGMPPAGAFLLPAFRAHVQSV